MIIPALDPDGGLGRADVGGRSAGCFSQAWCPGLLIALSMMATVYVYAKIYDYPIYAPSSLRELGAAIAQATLALMTPLIIVGGIVFGFFTPTEASVIAVVYSLILGVFIYRSIAPRELPKILYDSARFAAISLFCIGTASAFGWALAYFQIPRALVAEIEAMGLGVMGTGLMVAAAFLVIGMFIDAIPAIIILGTVLWPVATLGRHAPDPLRDHRRDLPRLRPGHPALRPLPPDRLRDRQDQGGGGATRRRHPPRPDAAGSPPDHHAAGHHPGAAQAADAEIRELAAWPPHGLGPKVP